MDIPTLDEARQYELPRLRAHIDKRLANVAIYQKAIDDERAAIQREEIMIALLESDNGGSE